MAEESTWSWAPFCFVLKIASEETPQAAVLQLFQRNKILSRMMYSIMLRLFSVLRYKTVVYTFNFPRRRTLV